MLLAEVDLIASDLFKNESMRVICPKCKGGTSSERSFLCSRDNGGIVYFKCFRASCGFSGKTIVSPEREPDGYSRNRKIYEMKKDLRDLTPEQVQLWRSKFELNPGSDVLWCPEESMYALKVWGPTGKLRGWILRTFENIISKSTNYPHVDEPFLGWYCTGEESQKHCVIVEDSISARKVCDAGFTGISLNGTHWGWDAAYEILTWYKDVNLALDRGTMAMMIEYREQFGPLFDTIRIWNLDKDLKYVSRERIRRAVLDGKIDFIGAP